MCLSQCNSSDFTDKINNQCLSCDNSCLTCSGILQTNCLSCQSSLYLLNSQCLSVCPNDYYENSTDPKINRDISIFITDIDNPYKFLVVFTISQTINFTIQMNLLEELSLNFSITIQDHRPFTYSLSPSGINATSFLLEITYPNKSSTNFSSYLTISFNNSNSPYYEKFTKNDSILLIKGHDCDETYEYYNNDTLECVLKFVNDFNWAYGEYDNEILLIFTELNPGILMVLLITPF